MTKESEMSLADLFLDYFNNYLSVEKFASDKGYTMEQARDVIEQGRIEHERRVEEYKARKEARIERMRARAERLQTVARENGLRLYGEESSGIPLGQPILVGHHSERRHRRALERIEAKVRKGFAAGEEAASLLERADAAESRRAIDSDNPDAVALLMARIAKYKQQRDGMKAANKAKRGSYAPYQLSNLGAEIRRLELRLKQLTVMAERPPEGYELSSGIKVEFTNGQVQVEFPWVPCAETREKLKRSPLALKWSSYSKRWVRKHTPTTAGRYFNETLREVLEGAKS